MEKSRLNQTATIIQDRLILPLQRFFRTEAVGGILLLIAAATAMILANSPLGPAYHHFWEISLEVGAGDFIIKQSIHHWINDGLMAVFFFLVGLEIKREILVGELASLRKAALPMTGALGGMIMPASLYLLFNWNGAGEAGWGIPMATDIAFALGALSLLGKRVPAGILIFLTALAIVDDLGAVLVIALFYGGKIALLPLLAGGLILAVSFILNLAGVRKTLVYAILGAALWLAFLQSGVHATVAGVLLALTIPTGTVLTGDEFVRRIEQLIQRFSQRGKTGNALGRAEEEQVIIQEIEAACFKVEAPLQRLERSLLPWTTFLIMPIFALSNAGVEVPLEDVLDVIAHPVTIGVFVGLVLGKQLGIMGFCLAAVRLGWAELPAHTTWRHIYGVSWLAGIGFTMSLFITALAFTDPDYLVRAKIAILLSSLVSGVVGYFLLRAIPPADQSVRPH